MAEWTSISDLQVDPNSPVTSGLMTALRDNPEAIAEGATGAPKIQDAAIASHPFTSSDLSTANGEVTVSQSDDGQNSGVFTAPGGNWTFSYKIGASITDDDNDMAVATYGMVGTTLFDITVSSSTPKQGFISPEVDSQGGGTHFAPNPNNNNVSLAVAQGGGDAADTTVVSCKTWYLQSSPPYDHGDGPVMGYIYALVDANGTPRAMYIAQDPPWYGNASCEPIAVWKDKKGRKLGRFKKQPAVSRKDAMNGCGCPVERLYSAGYEDRELTMADKIAGAREVPHPFVSNKYLYPVLIDPMDELVQRLVFNVDIDGPTSDMLYDRHIIIDNDQLSRCGPPGVSVHGIKWKNAGGV